jgi:predicted MFS family arabinose efflux permease
MQRQSYWLPIFAAAIALVVVHGFGRFVYTPLLPLLVQDGLLNLQQAASLATWNYVGYLAGALAALWAYRRQLSQITLVFMLLSNALSSVLQIWAVQYELLTALRFINGISNGAVFVLAPALVLEFLVARNKSQHSGLMYLGVGTGLLASHALVVLCGDYLSGAMRWLPTALLALPLATWSAWYLYRLPLVPIPHNPAHKSPLWDKTSTPLFLAYAAAGLGYILPMTFLPALAANWQLTLNPSPWLLVAIASLPSTWLWNKLGVRYGDKTALLWNYALQCLGVTAVLLWPGQALGLWLCAVLVGGTFLGAVLLSQRHARFLHPHQGPRLSAALVALYGFAQLTGPFFAKQVLLVGFSLGGTFLLGAVALLLAFIFTLFMPAKTI